MSRDKAWKQVKADWRDVVLVCRKCSKKLDGGFGEDGDEPLAKALRHTLDAGEMRKPKMLRREIAVIEVGCLDICPRKAVVVVKGSDPKALMLVPKGAEMGDVVDQLRLHMGHRSGEVAAE